MSKHSVGSVISFEARQLFARFPALSQIESHWDGLRQERPAPQRSEVDPRGLENVLEYAFILDSVAPGVARLRVAGAHLSDMMGMEVRGMPITALTMPNARDELMNALNFVFKGGKAHIMTRSPTGFGRSELLGGMVLLPLTDHDGRITKILGGLQTVGKIGREPRRFEIADAQLIRCEGMDPESAPAPIYDMAPPPMPGESLNGTRKLQLVVDNS